MRPTTERTREAIFSSLASRVPDARVLDLFAGSGGLGLEAWSRGAASVTAVEKSSNQWKILNENFQTLESAEPELGMWKVARSDVYNYLKQVAGSGEFDLIFADPPYDEVDLSRLLESVDDVLAPDGLLVFEMSKRDSITVSNGWKILKQKKYGSTKVLFLARFKLNLQIA